MLKNSFTEEPRNFKKKGLAKRAKRIADRSVEDVPGFGERTLEEGVFPTPEVLDLGGVATDASPELSPVPRRKRVIPGSKARAAEKVRQAKAQLAENAAELARLKELIAIKELEQLGGVGRRIPYDRGGSQLTEAEKDANRRALLAKCSDEFRRHDLTKIQSVPNPFSGSQGQDLDDFLVRFEVKANNCGWSEQDKVLGLAYHLDKGAALAYQRMIANGDLVDVSFNDAVAYLRAKYPQASPSGDQLVTIFRNLRQKRGESVAEFAERFQSALARTERFQGPMSAAAVITRFRASLRDSLRAQLRQVKLEALGARPLNGMIAEATHMETQLIQEGAVSDGDSDDVVAIPRRKRATREDELEELDPRPQTAKRVVRALAAPEEPWRLPQSTSPPGGPSPISRPAHDEMGHVLRQVKAIVETTQAVATRMQETQAREASERARQARGGPPVDMRDRRQTTTTCFKCGRQGHWAADCRNTRPDRDGQGRYERPRDPPRDQQPFRGENRYVPYRPPQRQEGYRDQGRRDYRRAPDERDHRRDPPRDHPRERQAAEPRQQRQLTDEERRVLTRSAEIIQGTLQAAMGPAQVQNPVRPN